MDIGLDEFFAAVRDSCRSEGFCPAATDAIIVRLRERCAGLIEEADFWKGKPIQIPQQLVPAAEALRRVWLSRVLSALQQLSFAEKELYFLQHGFEPPPAAPASRPN